MKRRYILHCFVLAVLLYEQSRGFHLDTEKVKSVSIEACSLREREGDKPYRPLAEESSQWTWCLTVRTDKNTEHLEREMHRTTKLRPLARFRFAPVGHSPNTFCQITYKGFQGTYILTPDLGHYQDCQKDLARYKQVLSTMQSLNGPFENFTSASCPLHSLPADYLQLQQCQLHSDRWYRMDYFSSISAEIFRHRLYEQFSFNHSETVLFQPKSLLRVGGDRDAWLDRLITFRISIENCHVHFLIMQDKEWPRDTQLIGHYSYQFKEGDSMALVKSLVLNKSLTPSRPWFSGIFDRQPSAATEDERFCFGLDAEGVSYKSPRCHYFPMVVCSATVTKATPLCIAVLLLHYFYSSITNLKLLLSFSVSFLRQKSKNVQ